MRYTIEEIRQMPEGQTFDCKSIHIEPKALANTIVAMANADGGMIVVGISDKRLEREEGSFLWRFPSFFVPFGNAVATNENTEKQRVALIFCIFLLYPGNIRR